MLQVIPGVIKSNQREVNQSGSIIDPEDILSLDLIRDHTKTEDVPAVTDELLMLYRSAALEAAHKYTGLLLVEQKVQVDEVEPPRHNYRIDQEPFFRFKASNIFAEPVAYYFGPGDTPVRRIQVVVGGKTARLPIFVGDFGIGCCNPCNDFSRTPRLQYKAGYDCANSIPAAIALGALKYIAHVIENPGDLVTATNEAARGATGYSVSEASNPALASGAIEIWRSAVDTAI